LLEKEILDDAVVYANELNQNSDFKVTTQKKEQIEQRQNSQKKRSIDHPGADGEHAKFLSNATHYSPTDPDARIATKPGKPRNLNYFGQLSVDTANHVITGACADFADKKDSQCLEKICGLTIDNLKENHIQIKQVLTDTGYCSGDALNYLEEKGIDAWMPNFGQFTPQREGFIYNKEQNQYECQRGNRAILPFKSIRADKRGYTRHVYRSSESACKNCPFQVECCGEKTKFKKIEHTEHHDVYMKNHEKRTQNEAYARYMSRLRSSTVEPVLGTLINCMNMKRVNTRGIDLANKHVLMAALTYNLKKYLKFVTKNVKSKAIAMEVGVETVISTCFFALWLIYSSCKPLFLRCKKI